MPSERLARLEACQEQTKHMVKEMHEHLVGSPGKDGLVTRVSKVEARQGWFMRIGAMVGSAVVGFGVWLFKDKVG